MKAHVLIGGESRLQLGEEEEIERISQDCRHYYKKNILVSQGTQRRTRAWAVERHQERRAIARAPA